MVAFGVLGVIAIANGLSTYVFDGQTLVYRDLGLTGRCEQGTKTPSDPKPIVRKVESEARHIAAGLPLR